MKLKSQILLSSLALLLIAMDASAQTKVQTTAQQITLFIHGAQVSRSKQIDIPTGETTLLFGGLSPYLDSKSLRVSATGNLTITAVNSQKNYLDSLAISKEQEELQKQIDAAQQLWLSISADVEMNKAQMQILKENCALNNKQNTTPAAIKEIGVYYAAESKRLKAEELQLNDKAVKQQAIVGKLKKQMEQLSTKQPTPVTEVSVKVNAPTAGKATFTLTYYVENAGWFPSYDIRSAGPTAPLNVTYKANMYQQSKEDWKNVTLTLSSSNPSQGTMAPTLKTYWLDFGLAPPTYSNTSAGNQISGFVYEAGTNEPLIGASVTIPGTTIGSITDIDGHYSLTLPNGAKELRVDYIGYNSNTQPITGTGKNFYMQPDESQLDEVVVVGYASGVADSRVAAEAPAVQKRVRKVEQPQSAVMEVVQEQSPVGYEFEIKTPYTILSNNKSVVAEIGRFDLPVSYLYQTTPKVDKDAFLTAQTTQWQDRNLLEGEANVYFENTFIGSSILNVTQQSDTLSFSMGRDRNIRIERTKEKDFTSKQLIGSNQTQSIAWKINIRNNRKETVDLTVYDQIPVSRNKAITVTAEELSSAKLDEETGRLTWNIKLSPGGQQELHLRYKVKYPKGSRLAIE